MRRYLDEGVEVCAEKYGITRQDQDKYATQSYARAVAASKEGKLAAEITPVDSKRGNLLFRGKTVTEDEQITKLTPEKITKLKPVFIKDGGESASIPT